MFSDEFKVAAAVPIGEEHILTAIAALGDVMRCAGKNEAGTAWHDKWVCQRRTESRK
jgi:hypothetical protein